MSNRGTKPRAEPEGDEAFEATNVHRLGWVAGQRARWDTQV